MTPKLLKTLLLAAALGFFMLWVLELIRTDLGHSYWLMMLSLTFLLLHQYYRLRTLPQKPTPLQKAGKATKRKNK